MVKGSYISLEKNLYSLKNILYFMQLSDVIRVLLDNKLMVFVIASAIINNFIFYLYPILVASLVLLM